MADAVDVKTIHNGRYFIVALQNRSDATGETNVTKVDISTLTDRAGRTALYCAVDRIEYSVFGMSHVRLNWDHTTPDEIATLFGQGVIDASGEGGRVDPRSAGGTGDILLSTIGAVAGGGYDMTLYLRPKA